MKQNDNQTSEEKVNELFIHFIVLTTIHYTKYTDLNKVFVFSFSIKHRLDIIFFVVVFV